MRMRFTALPSAVGIAAANTQTVRPFAAMHVLICFC